VPGAHGGTDHLQEFARSGRNKAVPWYPTAIFTRVPSGWRPSKLPLSMSPDSGKSRVTVTQPIRGRKNATSRAGEAESKGYPPRLPVTENSLEPKSVI